MITKFPLLLWVSVGCLPAAASMDRSVVAWDLPAGDLRLENAGYADAPESESSLIYLATPEDGAYHHHPVLLHHDGIFYGAFSECRSGEDGPGQRVRVTTSRDGRTWGRSTLAVHALDDYALDWKESGRMSTPIAWIVVDAQAWLISSATDVIGFTDRAGSRTIVSSVRRSGLQRVLVDIGLIATRVAPDGTVGDRVWLLEAVPDLPGLDPSLRYACVADSAYDKVRDTLLALAREKETRVGPVDRLADTRLGSDGHVLAEHTLYRRPDGSWVQLARDLNYSHRLYASESMDGCRFTIPVRTDIPDSASKTTSGTLPDGRNFIIGNFVHDPTQDATRKHYKRYPLAIALSADGRVFDRAWAVRSKPTQPRFEVGGSSDGYQYPDAVVVGENLWVIYSINKQDIAISRLNWRKL